MLLDLVICDDIRNEIGNKFTLVGVYGETIRLSPQGGHATWPALLPKLGVFIRAKPNGGFLPDQFTFSFTHNGNQIAKFDGEIKALDPALPITLAIVASPFPIPGPGSIQFHLVFRKGEQSRVVPIERSFAIELDPGSGIQQGR